MGKSEHPRPETLLRSLEGELGEKENLSVVEHLRSCWECRARSQKLAEGIRAFVDHRERRWLQNLPPAPLEWRNFPILLRQASLVAPRRSLGFQWRPAWIAAAALILVCCYLAWPLFKPHTVAANEVLDRARRFRSSHDSVKPGTVIYQKLQIQSGARTFIREVYRGAGHSTPAIAAESELQQRFAAAGLDWEDPLNPSRFSAWRDSLRNRKERVIESPTEVTLIDETPDRAALPWIAYTVRSEDWRPIAEQLRFQDQPAIEIKELALELRTEPTPPAIAESVSPAAPPIPVEPRVTAPVTDAIRAVESPASELDRSEMLVRLSLYTVGADLGEQLQIARDGDSIVLSGVLSSAALKQKIMDALTDVPGLRLELQSQDQIQIPEAGVAPAPAVVTLSREPSLEAELENLFPDRVEREAYQSRVLDLSRGALTQTWALRSLAERYPADEYAKLDTASRHILLSLLAGHAAALRSRLADFRKAVQPLGVGLAPPPSEYPGSWQATSMELNTAVRNLDLLATRLLTGVAEPVSGRTELPNLLETAAFADAELTHLLGQLEKP